MIKVKQSGNFKNTETFLLSHRTSIFTEEDIEDIANKSIELFKKNTPSNTGKTAESWVYEITKENGLYVININNENIQNGMNIAILVDSGHGTAQGRYVPGKHYIDSTIKEIFKYVNNKK